MSHRGIKALPIPKCSAKNPDGRRCRNVSAWGDWMCMKHRDERVHKYIERKAAAEKAAGGA